MTGKSSRRISRIFSGILAAVVAATSFTAVPFTASAEESDSYEISSEQMAPSGVAEWDGSVADSFAGGSGTKDDPYLISNGAELAFLASEINSGADYGDALEECYFEITEDIVLNNDLENNPNEWTPIGAYCTGSADNTFGGILNGNGHTISGLYISKGITHTGLFGRVGASATISNLILADGEINISDFTVTSSWDKYKATVGAFCGYTYGDFVNCTNLSVDIKINYEGTEDIEYYYGGICGYHAGTMTGCSNYAKVSSTTSISQYGSNAGGICGINYSEIYDSINYGNVNAPNVDCVGGICGSNGGKKIINCKSSGDIYGYVEVGGICGNNSNGKIISCSNTGIVNTISPEGGAKSSMCAGGIVGFSRGGEIDSCYNTGTVNGVDTTGGICGWARSETIIHSCYNSGAISNSFGGLGGIAGEISDTTILACYNTGNVGYFGCGIAGNASECTISEVYHLGDYYSNDPIGVLSDCTVTNAYYDNEKYIYECKNNACGRTTAQLTAPTAIADLGFSSEYWSKKANDENFNYYPDLTAFDDDCPKTEVILTAPINVKANVSSSGVLISWDVFKNATSYKVYRADTIDGEKTLLKTVGTLKCTDTTAQAGKTYYYFVAAYNSKTGVLSDCSEGVSVTLPEASISAPTLPEKPFFCLNDIITVKWNAVEGATSYRVYRATSETGTKTQLKTTGILQFTDQPKSGTYYYYIAAYNSKTGQLSDYSPAIKVSLITKPVIYTCTYEDGGVYMTWNTVNTATSYRVFRTDADTGVKTQIKTVGFNHCNDTNIAAGKTYTYTVQAFNNNLKILSASATAKTITIPSGTKPVITSAEKITEGVALSWEGVKDATSYKIYRADSATGAKTLLKTTGILRFTDGTAKAGNTYYYFVVAYNSKTGVSSEYSEAKSITV